MTEMTIYEAVRALVAPLDSSAIISDNAGDWTPKGLLDAQDETSEETLDLLVEPGQVIREYDDQGYLKSGEALYRVRSPASVSIAEVEEWVEMHIPAALAAVREVVASSEMSTRLCYDGREYWVWESGEIPVSVGVALRGVSYVLSEWGFEGAEDVSYARLDQMRTAMAAIDAYLPPDCGFWEFGYLETSEPDLIEAMPIDDMRPEEILPFALEYKGKTRTFRVDLFEGGADLISEADSATDEVSIAHWIPERR